MALSPKLAPAQQTASAPDEAVAVPITVRASNSAAQTRNDEFLAGFISAAVKLQGLKFPARLRTAVTLRPDLAGKIVVCALNIARLNSHLPDGTLSFAAINQIITTAVAAAPQSAADIVKAAIESEPYARAWIVAAAVAAAPDQAARNHAAANENQPMSMLASATAPGFNLVNNGGVGPVNSPEQPPAGP
jgi:hypothetical protein